MAFEVAAALHAPLDVFTVRKIGLPDNEEYALGAIATGGVTTINWALTDALRVAGATDGCVYVPKFDPDGVEILRVRF